MATINCEKCQKETKINDSRLLCKVCFDILQNKKRLLLKREVEYYKKKCRGLEKERDKLRSKVYYESI